MRGYPGSVTTLEILDDWYGPSAIDFADAWELQRTLHAQRADDLIGDTALFLEHPPVYTAGRRTESFERPFDGTPVVDVDRGGKITWHGPGQLVGYPIVRLPEPMDVVAHVRRLEGLLIEVLAEFDIVGHRVEGRSGVWVRRPLSEDKVAAIGVRVQRGVTMHGFALNCDHALTAFRSIVPCGIADAGVTTISEITGTVVTPAELLATVEDAFLAEYVEVAA